MREIFISYRSTESYLAYMIKNFLETHGFSVWMAPDCISGGSDYAAEIPAAIRDCKVVVLILSQKAQRSKWVRKELVQALELRKTVMPVMIENCPLSKEYNFYLSNVQRYEAFADISKVMKQLLDDLCAITGREPFEEIVGEMDAIERAIKEAGRSGGGFKKSKKEVSLKNFTPFALKGAHEPKIHTLLSVNTVVIILWWLHRLLMYAYESNLILGGLMAVVGFMLSWYIVYVVALVVSGVKKKLPAVVASVCLSFALCDLVAVLCSVWLDMIQR